MSDPSEFTCMDCLEALAVNALPDNEGESFYVCAECIEKAVNDRMLDLVAKGEMRIAEDGVSFETTELWDARRRVAP